MVLNGCPLIKSFKYLPHRESRDKVPNDQIYAKVINGQFLKMKVVNKLGHPGQKLCELIQIPSFFIIFAELFKMATKQILSISKRILYN